MSDTVYGNYYDKYGTGNPIFRYLTQTFRRTWMEFLTESGVTDQATSLLEIGCADGQFLSWYSQRMPNLVHRIGLDPGQDLIHEGNRNFQDLQMLTGSAYQLPFEDNSFDIVTLPEVFEHLDDPGKALDEVIRVSSGYILASVPWEPLWRICNMLRGSYLRDMGNTPGHVQHFSRKCFVQFLSSRTQVLKVKNPFPWTMVFSEVK